MDIPILLLSRRYNRNKKHSCVCFCKYLVHHSRLQTVMKVAQRAPRIDVAFPNPTLHVGERAVCPRSRASSWAKQLPENVVGEEKMGRFFLPHQHAEATARHGHDTSDGFMGRCVFRTDSTAVASPVLGAPVTQVGSVGWVVVVWSRPGVVEIRDAGANLMPTSSQCL